MNKQIGTIVPIFILGIILENLEKYCQNPKLLSTENLPEDVLAHIEQSLDKIRRMYIFAANVIQRLGYMERIPGTKIAKMMEEEPLAMSFSYPEVYTFLRVLINKYPNALVTRGAHGGIRLLTPEEKEAAKIAKEAVQGLK